MLHLTTLGGLSLTTDAGPVAPGATQRRKLALLALLAASPRGISRDKLVALLWPEAGERSARAVLAQTLYATRRALNAGDPFLDAAGALRLNPSVITADLDDWQGALAASDLGRAAACYAGPFLDGFHLPGLADFERWVEAERARLHQRYLDLLDTLATSAAREFRLADAVRWGRAAAAADPYSTPIAIRFVHMLALAGDRSGALLAARVHRTLLRDDLGVEAPTALEAAADVALHPSDRRAPSGAAPPATPQAAVLPPATPPTEIATVTNSSGPSRPLPVPSPNHSWYSRRIASGALMALLVVAGLGLWRSRARDPETTPTNAQRLLVLPFTSTDSSGMVVGADLAELLAASMDGVGPLVAVSTPPRRYGRDTGGKAMDSGRVAALADQVSAALVITGHVSIERHRVRVIADMYNRTHPKIPIAHVQVGGVTSDLFSLSDQLASLLIADRLGPREGALVRAAGVTTRSGTALNDYFRAESEYRALRFGSALQDLRHAVAEDSTFALAYYRMATTADWLNLGEVQHQAIEAAARYAARLGPHDRALVLAYRAFAQHRARDAERRYTQILQAYPDDAEAQLMAAEIAFHFGPGLGHPFLDSRSGYQRVLLLDPDDIEAYIHLARIAADQRHPALLDSLVRRIAAINPATPELAEVRALDASLHGDTARVRRTLHAARDNPVILDDIGRALLQFAEDAPEAAGAFRLSAGARPAVPDAPPPATALPAALALAQGRVVAMDRILRMGWAGDPDARLVRGLAALAGASRTDPALVTDSLWATPPATLPAAYRAVGSPYTSPVGLARIRAELWVLAALLDARTGRVDRTSSAIAALGTDHHDARADSINRRTAALLRIVRLAAWGDSAAALRAIEFIAPSFAAGSAVETWFHADLLAAAHRPADADAEYASVSDGYVVDEALVPWAYLRRAHLARQIGNPSRADSLRARGVRLLASGDHPPVVRNRMR